jgi:hypothetical protein
LHGGRKSNLEHFSCYKLLPNLHGFGINQKTLGKIDLTELWLDRLIVTLITNAPEIPFGQEVFHGNLQRLDYDLGDMHTLTLKIKEDIQLQRGKNVKLNPEKKSCLETELISSVWTLEKITC